VLYASNRASRLQNRVFVANGPAVGNAVTPAGLRNAVLLFARSRRDVIAFVVGPYRPQPYAKALAANSAAWVAAVRLFTPRVVRARGIA